VVIEKEQFNWPEAQEVKGLVITSHNLPDKSKFHCLRIILETKHQAYCSGFRRCWLAVGVCHQVWFEIEPFVGLENNEYL
jgi:hypothetical protein